MLKFLVLAAAATAIINRSLPDLPAKGEFAEVITLLVKADLALGCAIVEQNASPLLQEK